MATERDLRALRRRWPTAANLHRAGVPLRALAGWLRIEQPGRGPLRTVHHPDCENTPAEGMVGPPGSRDLAVCARVREDPRWDLLATLGVLLSRSTYCAHVATTGMARRSWAAHPDRTALIAAHLSEAHVLSTVHVDVALRTGAGRDLDEVTAAQVRAAMRRGTGIGRPLVRFARRWRTCQRIPTGEPRYLMTVGGPALPDEAGVAARALLATASPVRATSTRGAHLFVAVVPGDDHWRDLVRDAGMLDVGPADGSITSATWETLEALEAPGTLGELERAMSNARAISAP